MVADEKKLYRVMHDQWNPLMTAENGRQVTTAHCLSWGNLYAEIVRNGFGEIIELWPIPPGRVTPKLEGGELLYEIIVDGEPNVTLGRDKILHVPGLGFDGFVGYSVIAMARKSIGLGMALESFGALYFGQGTHPGVVVSHQGKLSQTAHDNLQKSLTKSYSGLGKSHRLLLLEESMKLEKIGIPPNDSQFLESRVFQISEVARWFNLNLHKLKELDRATNSNIESEQISFVTDCILPWLVRFEQNYNMQLLSKREKEQEKLYFKHNVTGLLRGDAKSRGELYKIFVGYGILTPNEVRELEDKNPHSDPLADELWMMGNMVPLSEYDKWLAKNTGNQITEVNQNDNQA